MTGVRLTEFWPFRKDGTHWHLQALCFMQKGLDRSTGCVSTTPPPKKKNPFYSGK